MHPPRWACRRPFGDACLGTHVVQQRLFDRSFGDIPNSLAGSGIRLVGIARHILNFVDSFCKLAGFIWRIACQSRGDPAHPGFLRRVNRQPQMPAAIQNAYRDTNCPSTVLQAGERDDALLARHWAMRPPPAAMPLHSVRASPPQADRSTISSSRGRSGRRTRTVGAAVVAGAAGAAALGDAAAAPPDAALRACWQLAETLALFFSRHCRAGAPPVGTPEQTFG